MNLKDRVGEPVTDCHGSKALQMHVSMKGGDKLSLSFANKREQPR